MARRCAVTGKGVQSGNNVSHANNKTRRRYLPNLQRVSLGSEALGRVIRLRLSTSALRSIERAGGLDAFLSEARAAKLTGEPLRLKKQIDRALTKAA